MTEKLQEFEIYRKKECKKANTFFICSGVLILLGCIGFLLFAPLVILFFVGIILLICGFSVRSNISKEFKEKFIIDIVKDIYPDADYYPKQGLDLSTILEPGFFKYPDRFHSEDYVGAVYNGVPFMMSDFTLLERHESRSSNGGTTVTYQAYAKGRFMVFDFKRDFNQVLKIAETKYLGLTTKGLEQIETESVEFNKKFKTYTSDSLTAFYVLTPQMQLKLLELESKFKGSIFFGFMKGKMYVAICDNVSILDINASKKVTEETLAILESQLLVPAAIINELKLDSDKFNEGDAI